jgi:hypothetical protein
MLNPIFSRFSMDLDKYPTISRVVNALTELPFIQKSHVLNQPDNPKNKPSDI